MNTNVFTDSYKFNYNLLKDKISCNKSNPIFKIMIKREKYNQKIVTANDFSLICINIIDNNTIVNYELMLEDNITINVTVSLIEEEKEILGCIDVKIEGEACLRQVQFPYVKYENVSCFDSLLMASSWGDNIERPTKTILDYCRGNGKSWVYDYIKCGEDEVIYTYPSIMAMQYMTLHNNSRSIYVASYSTSDETMTFNAKVLSKTALALSINHYPFIENGNWSSPQCGFSVLTSDWHSAADLYSSHMRSEFKAPDIPKWMKSDEEGWHGWVGLIMRFENKEPLFRFKDLPEVYKKVSNTGINTLQVAGWTYNGFDTLYPDFDYDPALGTKEELKNALDKIGEMGGHVILYTNGRLVDSKSEFYKNGGDKFICLKEDGTTYIERYNTSSEFRIACPSCGSYGEWMASRIKRMIEEFGADAAQVDQISCNIGVFCFDKSHPHPTPATNFLKGIEKELEEIRKIHKQLDPKFFVWCEGCHERFSQWYDVNQGHGEEFTWQLGESIPEQFLYNYPDRIVTGMSTNLQQLFYVYSQGKPFDVSIDSLNNEEYVEHLKQFINIRKRYPDYFLRGIFRDNVGLEVTKEVKAFGIEKSDGKGLVVNLWCAGAESDMACSAMLKNPRPEMKIKLVYPEKVSINKVSEWLNISWKGPVATLIFENLTN